MRARADRWALIAVLGFVASGCGNMPLGPPPPSVRVQASPSCTPCADPTREIERLRQDVASRDAEVRELRSTQLVQVKVLQESKREVTRAKVKLRRLATRVDAASYIAEVEVAMDSLRSSKGANAKELVAAQRLLDSTAAPFAQGDYGAAMERAAEAEQLIAKAAEQQARRAAPARSKTLVASKNRKRKSA